MVAAKSIEVVVNARDIFKYAGQMRTKRSRWIRQILLGIFLLMQISLLLNEFRPWLFAIFVYFAISFLYPNFISRILMAWYPKFRKIEVHVSWDDEQVTLTSLGKAQSIPWDSLSRFGRADEYEDIIVLTSGRGIAVPFPKTSFMSEQELDEFRYFVAEKMGDHFHAVGLMQSPIGVV